MNPPLVGDGPSQGGVLITGGAGYIGAHTAKAVSQTGRRVVVFDNFSHGFRQACQWGGVVEGDIRDRAALTAAMHEHEIGAVINFAGLIEVGRSVTDPDLFWDHNVTGLLNVLSAMRDCGVPHLVFSSSAAVYGQNPTASSDHLLTEDDPKDPASPYGDTKLAGERMIANFCRAFGLSGIALRYFNAAGADQEGQVGEAHHPETHLIPLAITAAMGKRGPLTVFGSDFDTPDGSCLRDYIHVTDLAAAHVAALQFPPPAGGFEALNVGTGEGRSVLQVIEAVEQVLGRAVPRTLGARRAGDPASLVADAALAKVRLGWTAQCSSLDQIVASAAAWHANPAYSHTA